MINTPHGTIKTPAFIPVGTQATVKSLTPEELTDAGTQMFFVNTYHAYLRPGVEVIKKAGGLQPFMHWDKPVITDSGGFQVFSLGKKKYVNVAISESAVLDRHTFTKKQSKKHDEKTQVFPDDYKPVGELVSIDEDGVTFTSHIDGSKHRFTAERSIEIQHDLGSDIMIAFDECAPYPSSYEYTKQAMERTHRWAERSLITHKKLNSKHENRNSNFLQPLLYGVIQGGIYEDLRKESANIITSMDFDGYAIGGVSVGESKEEMRKVLEWVMPLVPRSKPVHLLGVGEMDDVPVILSHGIDTFDCVQPTRLARMGNIIYINSKREIRNSKYIFDINKKEFAEDFGSLSDDCVCYTCRNYSRSYIHHLFRTRELLGYRLATIHNLFTMHSLVSLYIS